MFLLEQYNFHNSYYMSLNWQPCAQLIISSQTNMRQSLCVDSEADADHIATCGSTTKAEHHTHSLFSSVSCACIYIVTLVHTHA